HEDLAQPVRGEALVPPSMQLHGVHAIDRPGAETLQCMGLLQQRRYITAVRAAHAAHMPGPLAVAGQADKPAAVQAASGGVKRSSAMHRDVDRAFGIVEGTYAAELDRHSTGAGVAHLICEGFGLEFRYAVAECRVRRQPP